MPPDQPQPESAENNGHEEEVDDGLDAPKAKAISALLSEHTMARVAVVAGVGERTLRRWMKDSKFKRAYYEARRNAFGQSIGILQRAAPLAVATLIKVMHDPATPPHAQVAAAIAILRQGREGLEIDDIAERLETVEEAIAKRDKEEKQGGRRSY